MSVLKAHHFRCAFFYLLIFCLTYSYITIPAATDEFKLSAFTSIGILAFSSAISCIFFEIATVRDPDLNKTNPPVVGDFVITLQSLRPDRPFLPFRLGRFRGLYHVLRFFHRAVHNCDR